MTLADIEILDRRAKHRRDAAQRTAVLALQLRHTQPERFEKYARSAEGMWMESYKLTEKRDRVSRHLFGCPWHSASSFHKDAVEARRALEAKRKATIISRENNS